ncbi:hypothetical protein CALCODRAFT_489971 [Calocera cornea HHB12733]|uniref:Uncharacterized protein n=1 Tax=Calocera cornea HHB12733 TaxID=1353952 RepID=A0A165K250_9BASI|nr:hypothetical protein CALCODRAFT_489971 [Calocera cornea HHB12733]
MEEILENAVVTLEQISPSDKRYRIHIDTLHLHAKGDIESDMWFLDSKPVRLLGQMRFDEDVGHFFGDPRTKITFAILHSVLDLDPAFNIVFQRNDAFLGLLITDYAQFDGPHDKLHSLNGTTCQVTCMKASGDHAEHTFVHRPPPPQVRYSCLLVTSSCAC